MKNKNVLRSSLSCGFVTVTFQLLAATSAFAADWTGTASTDWNDAANWNPTGVPSGVQVNIFTTTPNFTVLQTNATDERIWVGVFGTTGRLDQRAGTLTLTGGGNSLLMGYNSPGNGTYNLANTAVSGVGISGFGQGSGSLTLTDQLINGQNGGSTGTTNINTTGTISVGGELYLGLDGGNGRINLESGTLNVNGQSRIAQGGSSVGRMDMSSGSYTSKGEMFIGWSGANGVVPGGNGKLNLSGGTVAVNSWLNVGRDTGTGMLNMSGGTMNVQQEARIGFNDNGSTGSNGTLVLAGGANLTAGSVVIGGKNGGNAGGTSLGAATMSGATTQLTSNGTLEIGNGNGSTGAFTVNAGVVNVGGELHVGNGAGGNGTMTVSGGTVSVANWMGVGRDGSTGTLTVNGTGVVQKTGGGNFELTNFGVGGSATLNLDGGRLSVNQIDLSGGNLATAVINFNGGTLQATVDNTTFISGTIGSFTLNVKVGGAVIDTNGKNIATGQSFVTDNVSTGGGLTKNGTGVLTLNGSNTYTGATAVKGGSLVVNGNTDVASAVTVDAVATLGGSGSVSGPVTVAGTIAPGDTAIGTLTTGNVVITGTLASQVSGSSNDSLAAGTLNITGATLTVTELTPGSTTSYVIATYTGSLTGTFTTTNLPPGYSVNYATVGQILLVQPEGYATWAAANGIPGEIFGSDFDNDGLSNGVEYALGGNPTAFTAASPLVQSGANYTLSYNKGTEAAADPKVAYNFETSVNLQTWTAATPTVNNATTVSYTFAGGAAPRFVRLKIVRIP